MDPEEREAMIIVNALRYNEKAVIKLETEFSQLLDQTNRLAAIVDTLVQDQIKMKKELATLRMYVANGWTS